MKEFDLYQKLTIDTNEKIEISSIVSYLGEYFKLTSKYFGLFDEHKFPLESVEKKSEKKSRKKSVEKEENPSKIIKKS